MTNNHQKSALNESLKAEEKKTLVKRPASSSKKTTLRPRKSKSADKTNKGEKASKSASKKQSKNNASLNKSEKKHPKQKVIRDSFTMPENEYAELAALKKKSLAAGVAVKKSELLRAGLKVLSEMSQADLNKQLSKLEAIKIGRPSKTVKK
jgi:hypothetical protein